MLSKKKLIWTLTLATLVCAVPCAAQTTQPSGIEELKPAPSSPVAVPAAPGTPAATTQPTAGTGDKGDPGEAKSPWGGQGMLLVLMAMLVVMFVWSSRGKKKQEKKRQQMLAALKKGDKVTSIGGIIGTIIEVRDDEIVVKVDETNNVRMHFARWAVRGTGEEAKKQGPEDNK
jgi:preprotein translocase subunit YajC